MKRKILLSMFLLFLLLFAVFTFGLLYIDVTDVPDGMGKIGFSSFNLAVRDAIGTSRAMYIVSEIFGYLSLAFAFLAAFLGLFYLIKNKSFKKVPVEIYLTGALYVILIVLYLLFDKVVINYRPVLDNGEWESSFPSSHTLLALCVCASAIVLTKRLINKKNVRIGLYITEIVIAAVTVITRTLSGWHWITDIIGCIFLSGLLICIYLWAIERIRDAIEEKQYKSQEN